MLDTLAQIGTGNFKTPVIVRGEGSDLTDEKLLKGRGKRKIISQALSLNLIKVAERKGDKEILKSLWNTYHCQSRLYSSEGRLFGNYCKNRFCTVCLGNRKAEIINKYLPVVRKWEDPHFVTLTVKSIPARLLQKWINKGMIRGLNRIIAKHKKRSQRGEGKRLIGIRALECNFNPQTRKYNPHFHIIVPDKDTAEILISEWLKLWTSKHAIRQAQHMRPVKDIERDLIETVKYGTKIFTEPDVNKKSQKVPPSIYIAALYNILKAMHGHRVFDRFGFNLPASGRNEKPKQSVLVQYEEWKYDPNLWDWGNTDSDDQLSNYLPSSELLTLLANNIDVQIE